MKIEHPYLMFLGDAPDELAAKTAIGIKQWRPEWCVAQLSLPGCQADLGLPEMSIAEAKAAGVKTIVLGVANRGGIIGPAWMETLLAAIDAGMDIANGLHTRLSTIPELVQAANAKGVKLFDVRHFDGKLPVGNGEKRPGKRVLAVGTDCSVGKMYTALALDAEMKKRGMKSTFRATGQTGIFIAGEGISVDAVISDFISGHCAGQRAGPLGRCRRAGQPVPCLVRRCIHGADPWFAARCHHRLPRTDPYPHAWSAGL